MIHYHGCGDSGNIVQASNAMAGRHAFVSFVRCSYLPAFAQVCQSFALDNGAFTIWKRGGKLNVQAYLTFVDKWRCHPGFDWAVVPDVIDGGEADNDLMLREWPHDWRAIGVPVWHMHESLARLKRLSGYWPRVAIGSSGQWPTPGLPSWWQRMADAMKEVCDKEGRPRCKLHGLRMLSPGIFKHLPFASADSTHAFRSAFDLRGKWNHAYAPTSRTLRIVTVMDNTEAHQSAVLWRGPPKRAKEKLSLPLYDKERS